MPGVNIKNAINITAELPFFHVRNYARTGVTTLQT